MKNIFRNYLTNKNGEIHLVVELPYEYFIDENLQTQASNCACLLPYALDHQQMAICVNYPLVGCESLSALLKKAEITPAKLKSALMQLCNVLLVQQASLRNTILMDLDMLFWQEATQTLYFVSLPIVTEEHANAQLKPLVSDLFGALYTENNLLRQTVAMLLLEPRFSAQTLHEALLTDCASVVDLPAKKPLFGFLKPRNKAAQKAAVKIPVAKAQPTPVRVATSTPARPVAAPQTEQERVAQAYRNALVQSHNKSTAATQEENTFLLADLENASHSAVAAHPITITLQQAGAQDKQIETFPCVLGRAQALVDCFITGDGVSRSHAKLLLENSHVYLQDLNSKFGTFVDDERLVDDEKVLLLAGTKIKFGNATVLVKQVGIKGET